MLKNLDGGTGCSYCFLSFCTGGVNLECNRWISTHRFLSIFHEVGTVDETIDVKYIRSEFLQFIFLDQDGRAGLD